VVFFFFFLKTAYKELYERNIWVDCQDKSPEFVRRPAHNQGKRGAVDACLRSGGRRNEREKVKRVDSVDRVDRTMLP
jgi:hypothetical protein